MCTTETYGRISELWEKCLTLKLVLFLRTSQNSRGEKRKMTEQAIPKRIGTKVDFRWSQRNGHCN